MAEQSFNNIIPEPLLSIPSFLHGIIIGILILSTFIWIGNYLTNQKKIYLLGVAFSNVFGIIYILNIFPSAIWSLFIFSTAYVFLNYGNIKELVPNVIKWYLRVTILLLVVSTILIFFKMTFIIQRTFFILLAIWQLSHYIIWIISWEKGNAMKVGVYSYLAATVGSIIEFLRMAYILPDNHFTSNAFEVGIGISAVATLLSFLRFVEHLRKARKVAQLEKEQLMQEQNIILEQKVEERTKDLEIRTNELEHEKKKTDLLLKKSDELLLNILPKETAEELRQHGRAQAKTYGMVTVLFTDFKDFSKVSEKVSPELLVSEIDYCFSGFDKIINKYKIEKIKTVGDAYICVAGMPELTYTHATDAVAAGIEIRNFMLQYKKEKEARGEIPFELRIGIHTGPVVAGVVGTKKFSFDIWGDTVNIAARMEQNSEAAKINISGTTYELVKDKFKCVHRGKIKAKNKGDIDMYFVETS